MLGSRKQLVQCSQNIKRKVWHVGAGNWRRWQSCSITTFLPLPFWFSGSLACYLNDVVKQCISFAYGSCGDLVKMQSLIQLPKSCYSKRSLGQQHQCHWKHVRNTDSQVPAQTCRIRICIFRRSPHDPYAKLKPELHCFTTSFVVRENLERLLPTPGAWCTCVE